MLLLFTLIYGDGGSIDYLSLKRKKLMQQDELSKLYVRNGSMVDKISVLKSSNDAVEGLARYELGLIKDNETYYQVVLAVEDQYVSQ